MPRRPRRAKTDRLAVHKRLMLLRWHHAGEQQVWSVVHVPSMAAADRRQLPRDLLPAQHDRTRVSNRSKGVRASPGRAVPLQGDFQTRLEPPRLWEGSPSPEGCGSGSAVSGRNWQASLNAWRRGQRHAAC